MREAMGLARALDSILVALCSRRVAPPEVAELGDELGAAAIAVAGLSIDHRMPVFATETLLENTPFKRTSDAHLKRNIGLLLSRLVGWESVIFLDDDIYGVGPQDARAACALLRHYDAVGLKNIGFPDHSVVCHVYREIGGHQEQFAGVGGLAINPQLIRSFFPRIYNQDWFFLAGGSLPPKVAITGTMLQKTFDPFTDAERAISEEFGDCLAEGLYWLLDHHLPLETADEAHWKDFRRRRMRFIDHLLLRLPYHFDGKALRKRQVSLGAAMQTCEQIDPALCVDYLNRWRTDLATWREFIDDTPTGLGVDRALDYLGLSGVVHRSGA
jgi:hypothetical protein